MRTTLNLNEDVINQVMHFTGTTNRSEAVNVVLEAYVREKKKQKILGMKGKLNLENTWELDEA